MCLKTLTLYLQLTITHAAWLLDCPQVDGLISRALMLAVSLSHQFLCSFSWLQP